MGAVNLPIDCVQGDAVWTAARCGLVTASRCCDVVATIKKGESAARRNYRAELISEILSGLPTEQFVTREMRWGSEQEPYARAAYEMARDVMVETCGFFVHPRIERFGASPDGLVGADGLVQIKCPNTSTHLGYMLAGAVPLDYAPQLLAELAVTGRQWIDFVSFDPRLPAHLQLFIVRFERDEKLIGALECAVEKFLAEIDAMIAKLPQDTPPAPIEADPEPAIEPEPIAGAAAVPGAKPRIDDVDPATGRPVYSCYAEYEEAKDTWLQADTIRQFLDLQLRAYKPADRSKPQ